MNVHLIITIALCSLGFIYQATDIFKRYFAYGVKSNVEVSIVLRMKLPIVSRCWIIIELLDYERIGNETGWHLGNESRHSIREKLTIEQIFQYTPSNESLLNQCYVRFPSQFEFKAFNNTECLKIFQIEKYIQRLDICYKLTLRENDFADILKQTLSPNSPGDIYQLWMSEVFKETTTVSAYIHSQSSSAIFDIALSPTKFFEDSAGTNDSISVDVTFSPMDTQLLPPPFTTMCRNLSFASGEERVLSEMREQLITDFQKVDTFSPIFKPYKYSMLTIRDLGNQKVYQVAKNFTDLAKEAPRVCFLQYHVTKTFAYREETPSTAIFWPQDPGILIKTLPDFELIDFIVYIFSSIGVWFGLSIFSILESSQKLLKIFPKSNPDQPKQINVTERLSFEVFSIRHTLRWQMRSIERLTKQNNEIMRLLLRR